MEDLAFIGSGGVAKCDTPHPQGFKTTGKYKTRHKLESKIVELWKAGSDAAFIAKWCRIAVATVYRILELCRKKEYTLVN